MAASLKNTADEIASRCLAAQARIVSRVITSIFDEHLRKVGLTASQMTLLVALEHTGGVQPGMLCQVLKLDKSTLSRTIERMQRSGWVLREPTSDARSHLLKLTPEGRAKLKTAIGPWRDGQAEAEAMLGKGGIESLAKATRRL